jgi:hypothetical protein
MKRLPEQVENADTQDPSEDLLRALPPARINRTERDVVLVLFAVGGAHVRPDRGRPHNGGVATCSVGRLRLRRGHARATRSASVPQECVEHWN